MAKVALKVEVKEEPKVMVEMTEAQKEKFVSQLAKESDAPVVQEEPNMDVELRFGHTRNGVDYGPGLVKNIPAGIAHSLYSADWNALQQRIRENESNERNVHILSRGHAVIVPTKKAD